MCSGVRSTLYLSLRPLRDVLGGVGIVDVLRAIAEDERQHVIDRILDLALAYAWLRALSIIYDDLVGRLAVVLAPAGASISSGARSIWNFSFAQRSVPFSANSGSRYFVRLDVSALRDRSTAASRNVSSTSAGVIFLICACGRLTWNRLIAQLDNPARSQVLVSVGIFTGELAGVEPMVLVARRSPGA